MLATARTVSLQGAVGHVVDVQVDITYGTVAIVLVGRPDASISEGRERCRAAVLNSGHDWPSARRVTILLSPTDLPKRGPHFDLAMAVAVLVANKVHVPENALSTSVLIGELSLDGRVRCVPGVLPMVMAAAAHGITRVIVPEPQAGEAALVDGVEVFGVRSLNQAVAVLRGEEVPEAPAVEAPTGESLLSWRGEDRMEIVDLADVLGMLDARYALEVAAAGGHHLLLTGSKQAACLARNWAKVPPWQPQTSCCTRASQSARKSRSRSPGSSNQEGRTPPRVAGASSGSSSMTA